MSSSPWPARTGMPSDGTWPEARTRGHGVRCRAASHPRPSSSAMAARGSRRRHEGPGPPPGPSAAPSMRSARSGDAPPLVPSPTSASCPMASHAGSCMSLIPGRRPPGRPPTRHGVRAGTRSWRSAPATIAAASSTPTRGSSGREARLRPSPGEPLAYVDPDLVGGLGPPLATNSRMEGGADAQPRGMPRDHRGLSLMRRAKAVFWWCCLRTEHPLSAARVLKVMPTDSEVDGLYRVYAYGERERVGPQRWGDAVVWSGLHPSAPFRTDWD